MIEGEYMQQQKISILDKWGSLSFPKSVEVVNVSHLFDQNEQPVKKHQIKMQVNNQMTIKQIIQDYRARLSMTKDIYPENNRTIVYGEDLILSQDWTIQQFKNAILKDMLCGQQLRLYDSTYSYLILQGCLNYENFQEKYGDEKVELTIKLQNDENFNYLYMNQPRKITVKQLEQQIVKQLGQKQNLKQNIILKYKVDKQKVDKFLIKKYPMKQQANKKYIFLKEFPDLKIRDFVSYGEIINLEFKHKQPKIIPKLQPKLNWFQNLNSYIPKSIKYYHEDLNSNQELKIQIQIYVGNANPENYQNLTQSQACKTKDVIRFNIPYKQVKGVKVKTLLIEKEIPNFQQITLIHKNFIIKPIQKFSKIEDFKIQFKNNCIKFVGVTQNFLFYKEIRTFSKSKKNKTMQQIYQELLKKKKNPIPKNQRKKCDEKVSQRKQRVHIVTDKKQDFLHPIILYTSPLIYQDLNEFSRQTSTSHFDIHTMLEQYWQYAFIQKLINSLQLIHNFQGRVYRGIRNVVFDYNVGDIIQFNSFTSTSTKVQTAQVFASSQGIKVLFAIQTFSGKYINDFSYFQDQQEVLLFPYTKFKVLRSDKVENIHEIQLLQIPVPKKIPGDIVVWIDANIAQNSATFLQITQQNKINNLELIQLISNNHLQDWLKQFRPILDLHDVNIHFITNLNRPEKYAAQGIQTLRIIRRFRPYTEVVFYIGNIQKTWNKINQSGFRDDQHIKVCNDPEVLNSIICKWKRQIN